MKQDNNTLTKTTEWWNNLSTQESMNFVSKYFPLNSPNYCSKKQAIHIYLSEHPEQPIKEDTLTKDEAIEAMLKGYKVTHQYFTDSEWAKLNGHFEIEFEDGCKIKVDDFWRDRKGEEWQMGWSIFAEPIKEQSSNRGEGDILEGISKGEWKIGGTSRGLNNYYIEAGGEKIAQIFSSIPNCEKNADIISKAPELAKENQELRESNTRLKEENKRLMDNMNIACRLALEFGYVECEKGNNIQLAFKNYASCKR